MHELEMNEIKVYDSLGFNVNAPPTYEGVIYQVINSRTSRRKLNKREFTHFHPIYLSEFTIVEKMIVHTRRAYNMLDLLKDTGGLVNGMMGIFTVIVFPFTYFNYYLKTISMAFIVKTKDTSLFPSVIPMDKNGRNIITR